MNAHIIVHRSANDFSVDIETANKQRHDQHVKYNLKRFCGIAKGYHEPWLTELLELATALYAADRVVRRPTHFSRHLVVDFPIHADRRERWKTAEPRLRQLLRRATGDDVELRFVDENISPRLEIPLPYCLRFERSTRVALLSDGLDSAAGAALRLGKTSEPFAFVSVITKPMRNERIRRVRRRLETWFGSDRVVPRCLDICLTNPQRGGENSQRFRTVLSIVAGLTLANAESANTLEVFENGIGILNLPAPNLQLAMECSQVLSPRNVPEWAEIAHLLLCKPVTIEYPFRWYTKAQLCSALNEKFRDVIATTTSCDGEHRIKNQGLVECGICGSCIARRMAIAEASIDPRSDARYGQVSSKYHHGIDVTAVCRLHCNVLQNALTSSDPWQELVRSYPTLRSALRADSHGAIVATVELLRRHCDELTHWLASPHAA